MKKRIIKGRWVKARVLAHVPSNNSTSLNISSCTFQNQSIKL